MERPNDSRLSGPASQCCGAGGNLGKFPCHFQKEGKPRVSFGRGVRPHVLVAHLIDHRERNRRTFLKLIGE